MNNDAVARPPLTLLIFRLDGDLFALPIEDIQEFVFMCALSRPPGVPAVLEGFLNLRGTLVPVLRLDWLLGIQEIPAQLYTPLIIIRMAGSLVALMVSEIRGILQDCSDSAMPVGSGRSFNDCAVSEVRMKEGVCHLLSRERILLEQERRVVAEWQSREAQRIQALA